MQKHSVCDLHCYFLTYFVTCSCTCDIKHLDSLLKTQKTLVVQAKPLIGYMAEYLLSHCEEVNTQFTDFFVGTLPNLSCQKFTAVQPTSSCCCICCVFVSRSLLRHVCILCSSSCSCCFCCSRSSIRAFCSSTVDVSDCCRARLSFRVSSRSLPSFKAYKT